MQKACDGDIELVSPVITKKFPSPSLATPENLINSMLETGQSFGIIGVINILVACNIIVVWLLTG